MTTQEFSDTFDTLIGAYNRDLPFGTIEPLAFDEYEKSVFLTKAQEEIVIGLYNGSITAGESFETSERIRRLLGNLVTTADIKTVYPHIGLENNSKCFSLPEDLMFLTYEQAIIERPCKGDKYVPVVPVTQDEYHKIKNNPFRGASDERVLRLDVSSKAVELISKYNISKYIIRYLKYPTPIILVDLKDSGLWVGNANTKKNCLLDSTLHNSILERAIALAVQSKGYTNKQ